MKPFRERNPILVGAASIAVLSTLMLAAFRADDLPVIGGGDTYYAAFSEAGGLKVDDTVRIAGVRVGKVSEIELDGDQVMVGFRIRTKSDFGTESRAAIKVNTILGQMYMALEPAGDGQLAKGAVIPVERTTSSYDVVQAFTGFAEVAEEIDTDQLAAALHTLADLTENTPAEFRAALDGVSRLSQNIAAKDAEINTLLKNLRIVSGVLHERDQDIIGLMEDADVLFRALVARRDSIHNLLVATSQLSRELTSLVRDSREDLKPALTHLDNVVEVLLKNQDNLDNSLRLMGPFYRVFANTLGNGPWFDTYIQNWPFVPQIG
ncbi:MCE family protein [Nocardioides limicola]|uniref:MCE family protein n=1 Tax=Nocardioides limicola TaxID=2803368 RepID=UPI00193C3D78|nr:MCE family protein [Nocardioides sp. DJM-14]